MPDPSKETADLAKAERDIRDGEARVAQQRELIATLRRDGHDTGDAEKLLSTLQQSLEVWKRHRDTILRVLATSQKRANGKGSR